MTTRVDDRLSPRERAVLERGDRQRAGVDAAIASADATIERVRAGIRARLGYIPWLPIIDTDEQLDDIFGPNDSDRSPPKTGDVPSFRRVDYVALWQRELRAGRRTATTFDGLWRAACRAKQAEEAEALLSGALETASPDLLRDLYAAVREAWQAADRAFLGSAR